MSQAEIAFSMRLEARDYQDGFTLMYRRRLTRKRLAAGAVLPFVGVIYGWFVGGVVVGIGFFVLAAVWLLWLATAGQRVLSGVQARGQFRATPVLREELHYRFNAEGLTIAVDDQPAGGLPWRLILGYAQDDKVLILYDGPMKIRVLPRRLIPARDIAGIIALAQAAGLPQR